MDREASASDAWRQSKVVEQLDSDLRVSHKAVILGLLLVGQTFIFLSDTQSDSADRLRVVYLALTFFLAVATALWLDRVMPAQARWFTSLASVFLLFLGNSSFQIPGFAVFASVPIIMAAALLGPRAALLVSALETGLVLLPPVGRSADDVGATMLTLGSVWLTCLLVWAIYRKLNDVVEWTNRYAQQASMLMKEAEEQRLALAQAHDDLARANLQLTRLNIRSQALREAAEDARTAKSQFVANVSHELRTPINMITGFTQLILASPKTYGTRLPAPLLADLAVVQRNAAHLAELIDDVLDLSQMDADRVGLTKEMLRVDSLVSEATAAVQPLFKSKGLYLETDLPAELPTVFCDRTRMRQVLLNLLSNAGRFTERGGVRVSASIAGGNLCVSVADTGPGISPEALEKIFEPFQQADGSIRRRYGGTGLGLNICRRFIDLHDGKIWAESKLGAGTTVSFMIPTAPAKPIGSGFLRGIVPGWEYLQRIRNNAQPRTAAPRRFVVLESGAFLSTLLNRFWDGAEIVSVSDPDEAISLARSVPTQAVLINHVSVGETLRKFDSRDILPESTPVIILSVPGTEESCGPPTQIRLVKPIDQQHLLQALARLNVFEGVVLIVDDEPDALQLFSRMLVAPGRDYRILLARDGAQALDVVKQCRPDVILLDLVMPNLDGFQFLELQSENADISDIPVVILSAQDPVRQPIVSRSLAATLCGGLSLTQLLACVDALSLILGVPAGAAVQEPVLIRAE